jgi:prepilin-type N-terminal cleavage/methylation domain-containing protein
MRKIAHTKQNGFTLIELLVVITIIGILASIVLIPIQTAREKGIEARLNQEFRSIYTSLEQFKNENGGIFPDDTDRNMPPGLEKYIASGVWPKGPWPGSFYDWDNWTDPVTNESIFQISVRFCEIGAPTQCAFPDAAWAENFDFYSSIYFCIEGQCRSHIITPVTHPGYCVNCGS